MESLIFNFINLKLSRLLCFKLNPKTQFTTQRLILAEYRSVVLILAEYEHIINNLDSLLEVSLVDTYYDIKLT